MSPIHALNGWTVSCSTTMSRRERGLITLSGIVPDFDGLGILVDGASRQLENPTDFWGTDHHVLGHNLSFAVLYAAAAFMLSSRRWLTSGLVLISFHLHFIGDVLGARGPDGDQCPIPYLQPFTDSIQWTWSGEWPLNSWQNLLITGGLMGFTLYNAWRSGISPLEFISSNTNDRPVAALRAGFGNPAS